MKFFRYFLVASVVLLVAQSINAAEDIEPLAPVTDTERCAV